MSLCLESVVGVVLIYFFCFVLYIKLKYCSLPTENSLECDCRHHPLVVDLIKENLHSDVGVCQQSKLGNNLLKNSNCPEMCTCGCTNSGNVHFMFIDCSSKNLSVLPEIFRNNFTLLGVSIACYHLKPMRIVKNTEKLMLNDYKQILCYGVKESPYICYHLLKFFE